MGSPLYLVLTSLCSLVFLVFSSIWGVFFRFRVDFVVVGKRCVLCSCSRY